MSTPPWRRLVVLLVAGGLSLWWWGRPTEPKDHPPAAPAPAAIAQPSASPTPSPVAGLDRAHAAETARRVLTVWSNPQLDHDTWWHNLKPLLVDEAQQSYEYTDPSNIPKLRITGHAVEDRSLPLDPHVATFYFKTTAGRFGVDVARSPEGGTWRGVSIIFPGRSSVRQG